MKFEAKGLGYRYRTIRDEKTFIYYNNLIVKTLSANETKAFINEIEGKNEFSKQRIMARIFSNNQ